MVFLTKTSQALKRLPLIKFRKGGFGRDGSQPTSTAATPAASKSGSPAKYSKQPAIEDWELPPRYRRKPIDPTEMDYINRGGPA